MAAKRSAPKKPAPKVNQPARPVVVTPAEVIRRNGTQTAPQPTPVEVRAEREPAVDVVLTPVVEAPAVEEVADWAPVPPQLGWWERMKALVLPHMDAKPMNAPAKQPARQAVRKAEMDEQMAVVKAGVLHELETLGVKKGVAVKGSPFSTILLPVTPKKRSLKWWVAGAVVLAIVGIMVWVGRAPEQPDAALAQALAAVRNHDVRSFEAKVDVASIATSIVNQTFNVPQQNEAALAAQMTAFVKPGLADALKDEILAAVAGEAPVDGDSLLAKLLGVLGGDKMRLGAARVAMQDAHMAVAEVPLLRADLGLTLPLQVVLNRGVDGTWQVMDIPNLGAVLGTVAEAERVLEARRAEVMAAAAAAQTADIKVESVKKAKDTSITGSSNLIVTMVLVNEGTTVVHDVPLDVAFGDAAGQPMMTTRVTLDGELAAGARREQVWSVPVDRGHAAERYVADLPLSALTVTVKVAK